MATNIIFFDDSTWEELRPLTLTRPVCEVRIGIFTIREKWMTYLNAASCSFLTREYLSRRFPLKTESENLVISGAVLPDNEIVKAVFALSPSDVLIKNGKYLAANIKAESINSIIEGNYKGLNLIDYSGDVVLLNYSCDIFSLNASEIVKDHEIISKSKSSQTLSATNRLIGNYPVFIEEGGKAECSTFNTVDGPVYIGKEAEVMEGCLIRGPFAMGEHSTLKMGAKIYGGTTIGPHCKVGGEVNNSVFFGYSNKAHDGFLGNSVIGEWVNIGADSNNSNLKNNYAPVKMWNYGKKRFVNTGLTFAGLIMGDHSKCSINTMFNTGTVCGVSCNLYGAGFHRNFIPSFTWGSPAGYSRFDFNKAFEVAEIMMKRRGLTPEESEKEILHHLFSQSEEGI